MRRRSSALLVFLLGIGLAACASRGAQPTRPLEVPGAVSGGTRGGGRPDAPDPARVAAEEKAAAQTRAQAAEAAKAAKAQHAEDLWVAANATPNLASAAKTFRTIADEYKTSPRAEEARWLEGLRWYQARDWNEAVTSLEIYVKEYPVNPHLAEAERMLYEGSLQVFARARGVAGIFRSDQKGYDGLNTIVDRFPEGRYGDDALLALGDEYVRKDELASACLQYRNLLLRYPDSEWSFRARLKLGDTYLARDQGGDYNAGYVDVDPRVPDTPQYAAGRPVKSCVSAALENFEAFLERIAADPGRRAEYARDVAYAQGKVTECRRRLAEKDQRIAGYYASKGQAGAADTYRRMAANVEAGRPWVAAVPPPRDVVAATPPARAPGATPPPPATGVRAASPPLPPPPPVPAPRGVAPATAPPPAGPPTPESVPAPPPPPPAPAPPAAEPPPAAPEALPPPRHEPGTVRP